jgi:DnaJ-class molecular chaperone
VIAAILMLLAGTGTGGWWYWNAHHRPTRKCRKCGGEKYVPIRGRSIIGAAERFKKCPKCGGRGRVLKWQARRSTGRQGRRAVS